MPKQKQQGIQRSMAIRQKYRRVSSRKKGGGSYVGYARALVKHRRLAIRTCRTRGSRGGLEGV
eukprot:22793-Prorocentrum_minimum.AAC.1